MGNQAIFLRGGGRWVCWINIFTVCPDPHQFKQALFLSVPEQMKMESAVEAQQGVESAVNETETQQITPAQIATLAQVTGDNSQR